MDFYSSFFHIIGDFFDFLLIDLFISYSTKDLFRQRILRPLFLLLRVLYDLFPIHSASYVITILTCAQILICCNKEYYKRFFVLIKYYAYSYISTFCIIGIHTFIFKDFPQLYKNELYTNYNTIASMIISYTIACMYFYTKKIKGITPAKSYIFLYYFISLATIAALSISPVLIEPSLLNFEQVLPVLFILITFIITFCLTTYGKIAITLEENAINKIQLEKTALEAEYNAQLDSKLQQLHTLRHDMKNHLIVIDSLSSEYKNDQIHSYIYKISEELNQTQTITSSSSTISALLNAKKLICDDHQIAFNLLLDFKDIYISDFTLITVLGNILDNAITASSKVDNSYINLCIEQVGPYLSIHCENSHCENIIKKEGRFISSKPSSGSKSNPLHGLGIISLSTTIEKNDGTVDITYTDSVFTIDVLLPNYQ